MSITDRELLEKAAKASDLPMHRYCEAWKAMARYTLQDGYHGPSWNPLTDDGDALRLAVKLGFLISQQLSYVSVSQPHGGNASRGICWTTSYDGDPYSATRRAIVCAAAEIGRAMP